MIRMALGSVTTGMLIAAACMAAVGQTAGADPVTSRIAVRDGAFVDVETNAPFTPLGVNYFRVGELQEGKKGHATFCPGLYDRGFVETMMAQLQTWGFNTVRTFHVYHVGETGILYLANVVHFLQQARAHGVRVIFSWDIWMPPSDWWSSRELPGEEGCDLRPEWDPEMGINAFRLHRGSVRTRANAIVSLIEALQATDPGLLPVVLAWELENEVYFSAKKAPLSAREGTFTFAGREYALSSDAEAQDLMDDVIVQWADCCADAIHEADPEALVSTGVFSFAAVGRGGPGTRSQDETGDGRIPARPLALLRSKLDYIDIHLYAWRKEDRSVTQFLERDLKSVEWETLQAAAQEAGKPVMCGECGVFANYLRRPPNWKLIDHDLGLKCFREHATGVRSHGLAGALYWPYGNPDSTPGDENPPLLHHPDYGRVLREVWSQPR